MECSPQYLSIWDVAHHWHDVAVPVESGPLLPAVRNMVTSLLHDMLNSDLAVYEPVVLHGTEGGRVGPTKVHMAPVDTLPPELEDMYLSGRYGASVLAAYYLNVDDVLWWAASNGAQDIPAFCISDRYRGKPEPAAQGAKPRPDAEDKRLCQEIARQKWAYDDQIRIAEMARSHEIQVEGNGRHYEPETLIRWLREVAPETVRNRPGRPIKRAEGKP